MSTALKSVIYVALVSTLLWSVSTQAQLSQNSGINSNDTWIVFDTSALMQTTVNTSNSYYNAQTQSTSNTVTTTAPTLNFHAEAGYDSSGGLVMNLWPSAGTSASGISMIRFASGQVTVFDSTGTPLPVQLPYASIKVFNPFSLLGTNPGSSVLKGLVISNLQTYAQSVNATTTNSSSSSGQPIAMLSVPQQSSETANANWTYAYTNGYWIPTQMVFHPKIASGTAVKTLNYSNVVWHDNASADSARASQGSTALVPPAPTSTTPSGLTSASTSSCSTIVNQLGGSQNVLFQHGLFSNRCTWTARMVPWLNQDFLFGTEVVPSLNSTDHLSNQTSALENQITSVGGTGYILIGHSQGGLINRNAAQYYQGLGLPNPVVKGVLTVDTPHQGAYLDLNGYAEVAELIDDGAFQLWSDVGCGSPFDNFFCFVGAMAAAGAGPLADYALVSAYPATGDLIPGSFFLQNLNAQQENFLRAAVLSSTPERWSIVRVLAARFFGCNPEAACGERDFALYTEIIYDVLYVAEIFAILDCDWDLFYYFVQIQQDMDQIDGIWNALVDPFHQGSDGIVQYPSQTYPSSSATQYPIGGADSHLSSTKSNYVRRQLDNALKSTFHVLTPASCGFSASPGSYSVSPSGGSSSFTLNTTSGCNWSAVSNPSWIAITSAASGNTSTTVSFSVSANPVTLPRSGTITFGNGNAQGMFTVFQVGACTYSLPESIVAIPAGGGTDAITVNTQAGCVWTAVPNANWLSISAGASGTGPGSFTLAASPNPIDADLQGAITVMNQTLTVILGDPTGTPGMGWVKFSGSPQSTTINPCQNNTYPAPNYCPQTIPNTGTIWVSVETQAFSLHFGNSTDTAAGLATALANQMNYTDSPLVATVSGSTVNIKSAINGAATNYSLSISYAYDSQYFPSPAFSATPSGTALTGGTN